MMSSHSKVHTHTQENTSYENSSSSTLQVSTNELDKKMYTLSVDAAQRIGTILLVYTGTKKLEKTANKMNISKYSLEKLFEPKVGKAIYTQESLTSILTYYTNTVLESELIQKSFSENTISSAREEALMLLEQVKPTIKKDQYGENMLQVGLHSIWAIQRIAQLGGITKEKLSQLFHATHEETAILDRVATRSTEAERNKHVSQHTLDALLTHVAEKAGNQRTFKSSFKRIAHLTTLQISELLESKEPSAPMEATLGNPSVTQETEEILHESTENNIDKLVDGKLEDIEAPKIISVAPYIHWAIRSLIEHYESKVQYTQAFTLLCTPEEVAILHRKMSSKKGDGATIVYPRELLQKVAALVSTMDEHIASSPLLTRAVKKIRKIVGYDHTWESQTMDTLLDIEVTIHQTPVAPINIHSPQSHLETVTELLTIAHTKHQVSLLTQQSDLAIREIKSMAPQMRSLALLTGNDIHQHICTYPITLRANTVAAEKIFQTQQEIELAGLKIEEMQDEIHDTVSLFAVANT